MIGICGESMIFFLLAFIGLKEEEDSLYWNRNNNGIILLILLILTFHGQANPL